MKLNNNLKLYIQDRVRQPHTPTKIQFKKWAKIALISEPSAAEITIRIVDLIESETLNKNYRHKNGPTNVLSFNYGFVSHKNSLLLGDLVMCAELVTQEAEAHQKSLLAHWAHLTVHGMLHLQGYDHQKTNDALKMEQLEIKILHQLGFTNPYE